MNNVLRSSFCLQRRLIFLHSFFASLNMILYASLCLREIKRSESTCTELCESPMFLLVLSLENTFVKLILASLKHVVFVWAEPQILNQTIMSQSKPRNTKLVDADAHKKALQHVKTRRAHWSVPKITAFCNTCKNLPELIDFNIKIEDAYQNFWKNDMRTVVQFAKRFIDLLKWITTDDHRQVIVLNFAYYDFALIQKIYTRFYHIESIVKRMQIAMSVIEIFQITPTLSSLNDAQRDHLNKIQQGILRTWMAFWSDDSSIKFFNISSISVSKLNTLCFADSNASDVIDDIDDLLIEQKDDDNDEMENEFDDNTSIFTIDEDENEDMMKEKDIEEPLSINSYLASQDRSGIPIIRTINIGDELNDINKQLVFISDIIAWLKQQIVRIKPKLQNKYKLTANDEDTFNAIIVCLRKLLLDSASITSLCVSTPNEAKVEPQANTSSYLRMIIDIVKDLTDECCSSNKLNCIMLFKSILADVAANKLTHHLVGQLLEVFVDRISNRQYKMDGQRRSKNSDKEEYIAPKYIFDVGVLNCEYFVDHGEDIACAYSDYLGECVTQITAILNKRRFRILYVLSSSSSARGDLMIACDINEVIHDSELELNTVISIVSNEMIETVRDGFYRLNIRFYPMYECCRHRMRGSTDSDFFYHRGVSLRDQINKIIKKKKKHNTLMKSVLCLAMSKQPTDEAVLKRFRLLNALKDILIKVHGDRARYEIFGSMATKLDHIDSDLDISIHLPSDHELYFDSSDELSMESKQHRIQRILKPIYCEIIKVPKTRNGYSFNVVFLEHATVPIVKLVDENNGLQSDISVCLTQSVIKTKLVKKYVAIDWRVKPLVLSIKHWVKSRKLNNTHRGDLNSFGFTLMIIHYLQSLHPPILPVLGVKSREPDWVQPDKFVGFGTKNSKNIGELFSGFFTYFDNKFKPQIHAISITNHPQNDKMNGFLNKNVCHLQNNHNNILIVLDPLDDTDNIGRRVTEVTWNNMKKELKLAAQITTHKKKP
eukprot:185614_1